MGSVDYRRRFITVLFYQYFSQFCGVNFFVFFATSIFDSVGQNGTYASFYMMLGNLLGAIVAIWTVNILGRKTNFVLGILVQGLCWTIFCIMEAFNWWLLLYPVGIIYMFAFAIGLAATGPCWPAETLPPIGV